MILAQMMGKCEPTNQNNLQVTLYLGHLEGNMNFQDNNLNTHY